MRILLINQSFHPDVVSTAQHLSDLAVELANRGHEVTVIAGHRGYDDPNLRFQSRELWKGVNVYRVPSTGYGKRSKLGRATNFASFILCCAFRLIFLRRVDVVVALTSPPLISFVAAVVARLRRWPLVLWLMDLNPDEAIAAGWIRERSVTAKALAAMSRYRLNRAARVIALDRFAKQRLISKGVAEDKLVIIPPWSHDDSIRYDSAARDRFRARHNLSDKHVVMYSGNHSPCHPLDTLLEAAKELSSRPDIVFCFVGGGSEYQKVKTFANTNRLNNIVTLRYQPMSELAGSLSAADLHVVVMGDPFVGIIHPCKIYNILSVGAPVLYIGPEQSHIADIFSNLRNSQPAFAVRHGDVNGVRRCIEAAIEQKTESRSDIAQTFSKRELIPRMIETLESVRSAPARCDTAVAESEAQS